VTGKPIATIDFYNFEAGPCALCVKMRAVQTDGPVSCEARETLGVDIFAERRSSGRRDVRHGVVESIAPDER
jgi:hypothetical protein